MATETEKPVNTYAEFQKGDWVRHPKFGDGQIHARYGSGEHTKLEVSFKEEGPKLLLVRLANLKRLAPVAGVVKEEKSTPPTVVEKVREPIIEEDELETKEDDWLDSEEDDISIGDGDIPDSLHPDPEEEE